MRACLTAARRPTRSWVTSSDCSKRRWSSGDLPGYLLSTVTHRNPDHRSSVPAHSSQSVTHAGSEPCQQDVGRPTEGPRAGVPLLGIDTAEDPRHHHRPPMCWSSHPRPCPRRGRRQINLLFSNKARRRGGGRRNIANRKRAVTARSSRSACPKLREPGGGNKLVFGAVDGGDDRHRSGGRHRRNVRKASATAAPPPTSGCTRGARAAPARGQSGGTTARRPNPRLPRVLRSETAISISAGP